MAKANTTRRPAAPAARQAPARQAPAANRMAPARQAPARQAPLAQGNGQAARPAPQRSQAAQRATQLARQPQTQEQQLDAWEQAKLNARKPRSGTTVPARKMPYTAVLTGAQLVNTPKGEKIKWTGTVVHDVEYEGRKVERWTQPLPPIGTPLDQLTEDQQANLDYLMRDFLALSADIDQMTREDITQENLDALVELRPAFEVGVVQNGDYLNCYFNKPITLEDTGVVGNVEQTAAPAEDGGDGTEAGGEGTGDDAVQDIIDIGSAVDYTGAGGISRTGSVLRFEGANGEFTVIRDDETGKNVRAPSDKVFLGAAQ